MIKLIGRILMFPIDFIVKLYEFIPNISLGRPFGIPLIITRAFVLWAAILGLLGPEVLIVLGLAYLSVIIHEFGHALMAKRFGYKTHSITIWPMTGMASVEGDWQTNSTHEFWITIAGPVTNIIQAILVLPFILIGDKWINLYFEINVIILAFNLIPIYPVDGGRLVHSFITSKFNSVAKVCLWTSVSIGVTLLVAVPLITIYWSPVGGILLGVMGLVGLGEQRALLEREKLKLELRVMREKYRESMLGRLKPLKELLETDLAFSIHRELYSRAEKLNVLKRKIERIEIDFDDTSIRLSDIQTNLLKILDDIGELTHGDLADLGNS